jgi:hypothetical protein
MVDASMQRSKKDYQFRNLKERHARAYRESQTPCHRCWIGLPSLEPMDALGWPALAVGLPGTTRVDALPAKQPHEPLPTDSAESHALLQIGQPGSWNCLSVLPRKLAASLQPCGLTLDSLVALLSFDRHLELAPPVACR